MEYIFPQISSIFYIGIGVIVLGVLLLLGLMWGRKSPTAYVLSFVICVILGVVLLVASKGGSLSIENKEVILKIPMYKQRVISANDILDVKTIDLSTDSPYKLVKKTSGTAAKNFYSGWFKLQNGEKAFLLLQGKQGVFVETKTGKKYIFGINNFEKLKRVFEREVGRIGSDVENQKE